MMPVNESRYHNQVEAINKVTARRGTSFVLDAPAGYGKTAFLQEIDLRFSDWRPIHISLKNVTAREEIVRLLAQELWPEDSQRPSSTRLDSLNDLLFSLTSCNAGLTIQFDDIDKIHDQDLVGWISTDLCMRLKERLETVCNGEYRIFLAGRSVRKRLSGYGNHQRIEIKPFNRNSIQELLNKTTNRVMKEKLSKERDYELWLVNHFIRLSGGHPGAAIKLLNEIDHEAWKPSPEATEDVDKPVFKKHVEVALKDILGELNQEYDDLVRQLSIYRLADFSTIESVGNEYFPNMRYDAYVALRELKAMKIVNDTDVLADRVVHNGFFIDPVIHYGCSTQSMFRDQEEYFEQNRRAQKQYQEWIHMAVSDTKKTYEVVTEYVRECIYHCLCSSPTFPELYQCISTSRASLDQKLRVENEQTVNSREILTRILTDDDDIASLLYRRSLRDISVLLPDVAPPDSPHDQPQPTDTLMGKVIDATVAVMNSNGDIVGTGFWVKYDSEYFIITCAHVVSKLVDRHEKKLISVTLSNSSARTLETTLITIEAAKETGQENNWAAEQDIAVLRAEISRSELDRLIDDRRMSFLTVDADRYTLSLSQQGRFVSFGFPNAKSRKGERLEFTDAEPKKVGAGFLEMSSRENTEKWAGISGSPVVRTTNEKVMGMIQAVDGKKEKIYLIPAYLLRERIAQLVKREEDQ